MYESFSLQARKTFGDTFTPATYTFAMDIHTRIKARRLAKGLSMGKLAQMMGVSRPAIQQWEKPGGTAPRQGRLSRLATILDTTPEQLLFGPDEAPIHSHPPDFDWPFPFTRERFFALPPEKKGLICGYSLGIIEAYETSQTSGQAYKVG